MSWDDLERQWRDLHAGDREHSNVSADTYRHVEEVITTTIEASKMAGLEGTPTAIIARLVVEDLDAPELEEIVRHWL